jgi:hypothetical protein
MMAKTGLCGAAICESLAEYCGESGNDSLSYYAIGIAVNWERNPKLMLKYIEESHEWCKGTLTWGCINHCEIWKKWDELKIAMEKNHEPDRET